MSEFKVVRGNPNDEELAAAAVVLAAELADPGPAKPNKDRPIAGGWNSYWRNVRQPFVSGPEAWRGSL
ncbi:acyl-CoA carboxylase epsilon subunit [Brooklawnia sp.]|uniref:acyl-CoA carboxylase epsilon subunit n=1 Tax=Brooklawnia sp. TaxID=2699740 RepID=UPI00311E98EE